MIMSKIGSYESLCNKESFFMWGPTKIERHHFD